MGREVILWPMKLLLHRLRLRWRNYRQARHLRLLRRQPFNQIIQQAKIMRLTSNLSCNGCSENYREKNAAQRGLGSTSRKILNRLLLWLLMRLLPRLLGLLRIFLQIS